MPKLLQINVTANWGSTGKIAEDIGLCAIEHGWESYMVYGRNCNPSSSHLIRVGSMYDTYIHFLKQRLFDNEGLCSRSVTHKLVKKIEKIKPDIVHLHNIHDHYLNYEVLFEYLNKTSIQVVWTMHDFWGVTGHCMHFVIKNCEKYRTMCYDCLMHKVYPKTIFERSTRNYELKRKLFSANKNLVLVPVSQWVGDMLRYSFLKDKRMQVIPNGIDINLFKPTHGFSHPDIKKSDYVIMGVASKWSQEKGLNDYITLSRMLPDGYVIILVGMTDAQFRKVTRIKGTNGCKIVGIGRTNSVMELAALYTRADVVTILSNAETFGLTVIEGYACGTPAIVYNNTAPPLLITEKTGCIVTTGDVETLSRVLQEFRNSKFKEKHSVDCRKQAKDHFDKNKCFEKYIELYDMLLNVSVTDG